MVLHLSAEYTSMTLKMIENKNLNVKRYFLEVQLVAK